MSNLAKKDNPVELAVRRREKSIIQKAARISQAALRAAELIPTWSEEEKKFVLVKPEGWTDREFKVAMDANMSTRNAPWYLNHAERVLDTAAKLASAGRQSTIAAVQIVFSEKPKQYDAIEVKVKD
jgi:hypothetical protein